jgi:hypothetical protein
MYPMKRWMLLFVLMGLFAFLGAQKFIQTIDISHDNPIVTRMVLTLSEKAEWTYTLDTKAHQVKLIVYGSDVGSPIVTGLDKNYLITNLDLKKNQGNANVILTLDGSFLIEKSSLTDPYRIVLDLFKFKRSYTYEESLAEAEFYTKVGKFTEANKQYTKITKDFPQNLDAYYYWGQMLIQQSMKDAAIEKLNAVPQGSSLFQAAQKSVAILEGRETSPSVEVPDAYAGQDSLARKTAADSVVLPPLRKRTIGSSFNIFNPGNFINIAKLNVTISKATHDLARLPVWFWVIFVVVLVIITLVIIDVIRFRKERPGQFKRKKVKADNSTKQIMVNKLLIDGWKEPEIARELLMSDREAKLYIKLGKKIDAKSRKN